MVALSAFPVELLADSKLARQRYFEQKVVAHQRLKSVDAELLQAIRSPGGASLILVFGPTGVGKTTLRLHVEQTLQEESVRLNAGQIPVLSVEAVAPDSGCFNWRDYYIRCLTALDEPLLDAKISYQTRGIHRAESGQLVIAREVNVPDLRRVLEKAMQYRLPKAVLVDEAQHFRKVASGRRLLDQMDTLKSLANLTGVVHVLFGTYTLLDLANLSGQLSRRSVLIHFPRYRAESATDWEEFKKLLRTFQKHLPFSTEPDLETHCDWFYERSLGCAGMLKEWLNRALAVALENDEPTLTLKCCERYAESPKRLLERFQEIRQGEERIREDETDRLQLRAQLGLLTDSGAVSETPNPPRRKPAIAQRLPKRDPLGESAHGSTT